MDESVDRRCGRHRVLHIADVVDDDRVVAREGLEHPGERNCPSAKRPEYRRCRSSNKALASRPGCSTILCIVEAGPGGSSLFAVY